MVDLDGAFDGAARSRNIVQRICREIGIPVQLGGGIRDMATAEAYLEAGVARLIIGTLALEQPDVFAGSVELFRAASASRWTLTPDVSKAGAGQRTPA